MILQWIIKHCMNESLGTESNKLKYGIPSSGDPEMPLVERSAVTKALMPKELSALIEVKRVTEQRINSMLEVPQNLRPKGVLETHNKHLETIESILDKHGVEL